MCIQLLLSVWWPACSSLLGCRIYVASCSLCEAGRLLNSGTPAVVEPLMANCSPCEAGSLQNMQVPAAVECSMACLQTPLSCQLAMLCEAGRTAPHVHPSSC